MNFTRKALTLILRVLVLFLKEDRLTPDAWQAQADQLSEEILEAIYGD